MIRVFGLGLGCFIAVLGLLYGSSFVGASPVEKEDETSLRAARVSQLPAVTKKLILGKIEQPKWLKEQKKAEEAAATQRSITSQQSQYTSKTIAYSVETRGAVKSDVNLFRRLANQTLNDSRGWSKLGITFKETSGKGAFVLILATPSQVAAFSSGCSAMWSCTVSPHVIINDDRWSGATNAWNGAGGSLRDYRHYVINHEIGHWLGNNHRTCSGAGQAAPVMLQQSIDLQGCKFNPWPLAREMYSPKLGLRS